MMPVNLEWKHSKKKLRKKLKKRSRRVHYESSLQQLHLPRCSSFVIPDDWQPCFLASLWSNKILPHHRGPSQGPSPRGLTGFIKSRKNWLRCDVQSLWNEFIYFYSNPSACTCHWSFSRAQNCKWYMKWNEIWLLLVSIWVLKKWYTNEYIYID